MTTAKPPGRLARFFDGLLARRLVGMWGHPDQTEGPAAFAEKREPDWLPLEPE